MSIIDNPYTDYYTQAANKYGVDSTILQIQGFFESGFNPTATSPVGAKGIAQFMPETAKKYGVDVNNVESSIYGQAHYLSDLYKNYGNYRDALIAYNGGGKAVDYLKYGAGNYAYLQPDKNAKKGSWVRESSGYANGILDIYKKITGGKVPNDNQSSSPTSKTDSDNKGNTGIDNAGGTVESYFQKSEEPTIMDYIKKGSGILFGSLLILLGFYKLVK